MSGEGGVTHTAAARLEGGRSYSLVILYESVRVCVVGVCVVPEVCAVSRRPPLDY